MRKWLGKNSITFIAGLVMTYFAVKYSYQKRGSMELGSEYIFLFLPLINHKLKEVGIFTKEVAIELINEIREELG